MTIFGRATAMWRLRLRVATMPNCVSRIQLKYPIRSPLKITRRGPRSVPFHPLLRPQRGPWRTLSKSDPAIRPCLRQGGVSRRVTHDRVLALGTIAGKTRRGANLSISQQLGIHDYPDYRIRSPSIEMCHPSCVEYEGLRATPGFLRYRCGAGHAVWAAPGEVTFSQSAATGGPSGGYVHQSDRAHE
jgi:hypothetical protein